MMKERVLRYMLVASVALSLFTTISFIYFIDSFPVSGEFVLSMRQIDFLNGSVIINNSLAWMYFFIGFNILTLGLAIFYVKPSEQKLLEISLYNVVLSILFVVALYLFVSMFPETIIAPVEHKLFFTEFVVEGDVFRAVNLIYVLFLGYFILNTIFISSKSED